MLLMVLVVVMMMVVAIKVVMITIIVAGTIERVIAAPIFKAILFRVRGI